MSCTKHLKEIKAVKSSFGACTYENVIRRIKCKSGEREYFQESLHQDSNDNGVRIVNFATSKNLVVKSTMFPHRNIHKYTCTSSDGKTHNQIDHILIDRRWHSSVLDVRSFRGADCDTDHYLVIAKVREKISSGQTGRTEV